MKAAVMTAPFQISIQEVPRPVVPPREVLVKMVSAGICGSDLHFFDGSNPYADYPHIYGHELSGTIEELGEGVTGVKIGEPVIVEPTVPCGKCYACRRNKTNCCSNIKFISVQRDGGFAQYVAVPANLVHRIPQGMSFDTAALAEPFTIGMHMINRAAPRSGETVTILGCGPIGLTAVILLKKLYNVKVFAVDVVPERLAKAKAYGADYLINPRNEDTLKAIDELTEGEGSNIVIEVAGLKQTMEQTIHLVSRGGRIVITGLSKDDISFPGIMFTNKEVEIYGSRNSVGVFPQVIDFLHKYPDVAEQFITKRMPFNDISEAMHLAKSQPNEITKIILQY